MQILISRAGSAGGPKPGRAGFYLELGRQAFRDILKQPPLAGTALLIREVVISPYIMCHTLPDCRSGTSNVLPNSQSRSRSDLQTGISANLPAIRGQAQDKVIAGAMGASFQCRFVR